MGYGGKKPEALARGTQALMFWRRIADLPWWAISLSLGVNILSLFIVIVCIVYLKQDVTVIVTAFLFIHVFISQPIKDWIIQRMDLGQRYSGQLGFLSFENRVSRIARVQDVLEFLGWLLRAWQLGRLRLLIFDEEDFIYYFAHKKRVRKMRLKDDITAEFRRELAAHTGARPVHALSPGLRTYMQARKVRFIAPLLFRDRLIGLLGFNNLIDKARLPLLDHAAHRIGLALENEQLERTVPRSEFLKKEFRVAERIEQHLSGAGVYHADGMSVQKLETAWDKKHFAAIFGVAPGKTIGEDKVHFVMLLRLSIASTRANALQLFSTQGYFYALARHEASVEGLAVSLGRSLRNNENQAIELEGFLVALSKNTSPVSMATFGSHLAYRAQGGWTWIPETPALGRDPMPARPILIAPQKEIILSVREYPLIVINGGIAP